MPPAAAPTQGGEHGEGQVAGTVEGESTFSTLFTPRCLASLRNCGQLAWTRKLFCAERPVRRPTAEIQCVPGSADAGTSIVTAANAPLPSVEATARSNVSKKM